VRHTQKDDIISFTENMEKMVKDVAEKAGLGIEIYLYMDEDPVPMSQDIVNGIANQCEELKLNYKVMHSGAGHDTQRFDPVVPSALIFVPSRAGISHITAEYTEPKELAEGVRVLAHSLYELAYKEEN